LVILAIGTALAVFYYTSGSETEQFERKFQDDAHKVLEAIGSSLDQTFGTFDSLAVAAVSFARASHQVWPNVTIPDFAIRAAKVLELSDAFTINLVPFVTPAQRLGWEEYSGLDESLAWVNESFAVQETWEHYYGPHDQWDWERYNVIHGDFGDVPYNSTRVMMPTWQNFPVVMDGWPPANWGECWFVRRV